MKENAYPISDKEILEFEKLILKMQKMSEEKISNLLSAAKQLAEERA